MLIRCRVTASRASAHVEEGESFLDFLGHVEEEFTPFFNRHLGLASCTKPMNTVHRHPFFRGLGFERRLLPLCINYVYLRGRGISSYFISIFLVAKNKPTLIDLFLDLLFPRGAIACSVAPRMVPLAVFSFPELFIWRNRLTLLESDPPIS